MSQLVVKMQIIDKSLLPMTLFSQEKKTNEKQTTPTEQLNSLQFKRLDINSALQRRTKGKISKKGLSKIRWERMFTTVGGSGAPKSYLSYFLIVFQYCEGLHSTHDASSTR